MTYELEIPARGDCDCCGKSVPLDDLTRCWVTGLETYACSECRSDDDDEAADYADFRYHQDHDC